MKRKNISNCMDDDVLKSINTSVLCWLSTIDENGFPNVSPKEIFCASGNHSLLIANIASPTSLKNILENPVACVSFIDIFIQKGFKIKGNASVIHKQSENFLTLASPLKMIAGEKFPFSTLFKIDIFSIKPILAPSYRLFPDTAEADQIHSAMLRYGVRPL